MKYLLYSIISGLLFGLGNTALKILVGKNEIYLIIFDPTFFFLAIFGSIAFLLSQLALKNMKGSTVTLIITVTITIVSIIGGIFLGEVINVYEEIGLILMISSVYLILLRK